MELISKYQPLFKMPPPERYFLITGGRGSAKSFHVSLFVLNLTYEPNQVILFTRWTLTSAYISIIPEFIEKMEMLNKQNDFEITQTEIINKHSGSRILFRGIKTSQGTATANLKSIAGVTCWILDEAEELVDEDIFDKIDLSIRAKHSPNRVVLVMNPSFKTHWIYRRFVTDKSPCEHIHTTYLDNIKNLSDSFIETAERSKKTNLLKYNHLFLGEWLEESEGLLWSRQIIERQRTTSHPELKRIIISIDPAASHNKNSDETGITVLGVDYNNKGYMLEDLSGKYSPAEWGSLCASALKRWGADYYVAEKNQGGDMVEAVIRQYDRINRIKMVHATKGKFLRADPVYSLYEQGIIYHCGNFPILERQMITFNPDSGESPDRVDALVHGFTDLLIKKKETIVI